MNPVILVHGIFDNSNCYRKMSEFLKKEGFEVFAISFKPNSGKTGLEKLAVDLKSFINSNISNNRKFFLIGFSMGGLICRYYIQRLSGIDRVKQFISLSTPHNGSFLAYLWFNKGCKQMRPGSVFLKDLNSDIGILDKVNIISIWTPFDLSILPPSSSQLSIGEKFYITSFDA